MSEEATSSTQTVPLTELVSNMDNQYIFPDFNQEDIQTWFDEIDLWIKIQKINDGDKIYCALMKKIPKEFFKLVAHRIDHSASGSDKFDLAKRLIIEEANKLNKDSIDLFNACVKRSDVTFVQFLGSVRRLAKPENLSEAQIKKKFLASLSSDQISTANIILRTDTIDVLASTLDDIERCMSNRSLYAISNSTKNSEHSQSRNSVPRSSSHSKNDSLSTVDFAVQDERISRLEYEIKNKFGIFTRALTKLESSINNLALESKNRDGVPSRSFANGRSHSFERGDVSQNREYSNYQNAGYDNRNYRNFNNGQSPQGIRNRQVRFDKSTYDSNDTCRHHLKWGKKAYNCESFCKFFNEERHRPSGNE